MVWMRPQSVWWIEQCRMLSEQVRDACACMQEVAAAVV